MRFALLTLLRACTTHGLALNRRQALGGGAAAAALAADPALAASKPIAVIGSGGRTGSLCVAACLKRGLAVKALSRAGAPPPGVDAGPLLSAAACDVRDPTTIDVNGAGQLLTTESCLLHPNRNPRLAKHDIESRLRDFLGIEKITWLGEGIEGDDTDGHIDDISRFVSANTVVTAVEPDAADRNHAPLQANRERLGQAFDVIELPMPRRIEQDGQRLPASYANFYICNAHVIVPTYRDANDDRALGLLREAFPGRTVTGLDSTDLIWGLGSFHCLTQQEPAAK